MAFEMFDPKELETVAEEVPTAPVLLMTREAINGLLEESTAALDAINVIQDNLQLKTAKIDPRFSSKALSDTVNELRLQMQPVIDGHLVIIRKNAAIAKDQGRFWTNHSMRLRASFTADPVADSTVRLSWLKRLESTHAALLVEVAALACSTGNLALCHVIELELERREGTAINCNRSQRDEIHSFIAAVPSGSKEVLQTLAEVGYLVATAAMAASGKIVGRQLITQGLHQNQF